jgi:hypothetical protein
MFAMPALLSVYPDALFVQTHRTPIDAMASVSSLVTILRSAFSGAVDPVTVCREAIDYWSETMERFLNERDRLASKRICDVEYDEISRNPIAAVRRIYDHFGWSLSQQAEQRMHTLVASHAQRQPGNHRYHLSQFGFTAEEVLSAFAPYCQQFGLSPLSGEKLSRSLRDSALPKAQKRSGLASFTGTNGESDG